MGVNAVRYARFFAKKTRFTLGLFAAACLFAGGVLSASGMSTSNTATARAAVSTVTVIAGKPSELAFKLSTKQVTVGKVTFKVTNQGRLPHTFEVCSSPKGGAKNTCKGKVTKSLAHGQSATLVVTLVKGQFEYLCTIPGHAAAGMKGVLGAGVKPTPLPVSKPTAGTTTSSGSTTPPPATETLIGDPGNGRTVFTASANPPCTSCHTLAAAGSKATVGPNLDSLAPPQADVVNAVTYGLPGGMPAFGASGGGNLSAGQINDVASFVYASTHH
jgi:cytochrome c6